MLYAVTKGMDQNVVALHAANGMLDKDADATQSGIGSFLLIAQLRAWVLFTCARLLYWYLNLISTIVRSNTERT